MLAVAVHERSCALAVVGLVVMRLTVRRPVHDRGSCVATTPAVRPSGSGGLGRSCRETELRAQTERERVGAGSGHRVRFRGSAEDGRGLHAAAARGPLMRKGASGRIPFSRITTRARARGWRIAQSAVTCDTSLTPRRGCRQRRRYSWRRSWRRRSSPRRRSSSAIRATSISASMSPPAARQLMQSQPSSCERATVATASWTAVSRAMRSTSECCVSSAIGGPPRSRDLHQLKISGDLLPAGPS